MPSPSWSFSRPRAAALVLSCLFCALGSVTALAPTAHAQTTPQLFFWDPTTGTNPTSYTQGITSLGVSANATFTISVWYQYTPSFTYTGMNAFVGFDSTTGSGPSATPINNRLGPAGSGDPNDPLVVSFVGDVNHRPAAPDANQLGGGRDADGGMVGGAIRPYGVDVPIATGTFDADGIPIAGYTGTGVTPVHLFDLKLTNFNLGAGSQSITIYSVAGPASGQGPGTFTSYVTDGGDNYAAAQLINLVVFQPVPVAPIHVALPTGLLMLAATNRKWRAFRRRNRANAVE